MRRKSSFKFRPVVCSDTGKPGSSPVSDTECLGTIRQVTQTELFIAEHLRHFFPLFFECLPCSSGLLSAIAEHFQLELNCALNI